MLVFARDSAAQNVSVMAQAIPTITSARPTATRGNLTEAYLTQPAIMVHASWAGFTGIGTLNLEGLTLERGELTTGAYGEGYVDRRHPHAYVHELLAGRDVTATRDFSFSVFGGRGFAPFGSDDPMVRPIEKYPVNHHLSQVLERIVGVGALRYRKTMLEVGTFNGDEPLGPGAPPNLARFGDSWSTRLTVLPLNALEVSGSLASVRSPEVRAGGGLDQWKHSVTARYERVSGDNGVYGMAEWSHTDERDRGVTVNRLGSVLGEGSVCRAGAILSGRWERTDRPEEEPTLDPFRTPRPPSDLSNLGESRWTILTGAVSSPALRSGWLSGRPFVEVAYITAARGHPGGLFDPVARYGTSHLWMLSAGVRLHAGASGMHDRMGRYGVALPVAMAMQGMAGMQDMSGMQHTQPSMGSDRCRL